MDGCLVCLFKFVDNDLFVVIRVVIVLSVVM